MWELTLRLSEDQKLQAKYTPISMIPDWSKPGAFVGQQGGWVGGAKGETTQDPRRQLGPDHMWPKRSCNLTLSEVGSLWKEIRKVT